MPDKLERTLVVAVDVNGTVQRHAEVLEELSQPERLRYCIDVTPEGCL